MADIWSILTQANLSDSPAGQPPTQEQWTQLQNLLASHVAPGTPALQGMQMHENPVTAPPAWIQGQTIEPVAFGSLADPVSQLAFLGAPGLLRAGKGALEAAATPGPRFGGLASERGNLGPPPLGPRGEPLPGSVMRNQAGDLERYYHGTNRQFPDFEMSKAGSGAGGDLYGPGIYMTNNPDIAGEYAALVPPQQNIRVLGENLNFHDIDAHLRAHYPRAIDAEGNLAPDIRLAPTYRRDGQKLYNIIQDLPDMPNTRPVYPDLKNPFRIDQRISEPAAKTLLEAAPGMSPGDVAETLRNYTRHLGKERFSIMRGDQLYDILISQFGGDRTAVNEFLQQQGYDGITHIGGSIMGGGQPHRVAIAFSPDNVYPSFSVDMLKRALSQGPR